MALSKKKEQDYLEKVKKDGLHLRRITKNQTLEICLAAVKQNGLALKYVAHQTPELCLMAIQQNPWALKYVENQTEKLCLEAVKQNGYLLDLVRQQTEEICLATLSENPRNAEKIKNPTTEMLKIYKSFLKEDRATSIPYRQIRYLIVTNQINLVDSPYHILECLYR